MATKYLTKSADVLNEADRFQRILDWELFTSEQEARLNGYNGRVVARFGKTFYSEHPMGWVPGVPIYKHPAYLFNDWNDTETDDWSGQWGNHPRPLIQLLEIESPYTPHCIDCEVMWDRYAEDSCWNCGKEYPRLETTSFKYEGVAEFSVDLGLTIRFEDEYLEQMRLTLREVSREYRRATVNLARGFNRMASAIDEMRNYMAFDVMATLDTSGPWGAEPFVEPRGRSFHNPIVEETSIFERPNLRGPCWGTAVLFDPREESSTLEINSMYGRVPRNWRQMRATPPVPKRPEPMDFNQMSNARTGPPTTPNWRNR